MPWCYRPIKCLNSEGNSIINGKTVTGFSNTEEEAVGLADKVPYLTEDELKNRGAHYEKVTTGVNSLLLTVMI